MPTNSVLTLAQAAPADPEGAGAFWGIVIIIGLLIAIIRAATKKKEYDVHMRGQIRER